MLKTCSHCGVVPDNHVCPHKRNKKKFSEANDIRKTNRWHVKSKQIKERDNYLCRICLLDLYGTMIKYNPNNLETHHIVPLNEDSNKAFEDNNLITLCKHHHEMAESGRIPRIFLLKIVEDNIRSIPPAFNIKRFKC